MPNPTIQKTGYIRQTVKLYGSPRIPGLWKFSRKAAGKPRVELADLLPANHFLTYASINCEGLKPRDVRTLLRQCLRLGELDTPRLASIYSSSQIETKLDIRQIKSVIDEVDHPELAELKELNNETFSEVLFMAFVMKARESSSPREIIKAFKRALEIKPSDANIHFLLGLVYQDLGRDEDAIFYLERAIDFDSSLSDAHLHLGLAFKNLKEYKKAIACYREATKSSDPALAANAYDELGIVFSILGQRETAINAYQEAIKHNPYNAGAFNDLGNIYSEMGNHNKAIAMIQKAIRLDPSRAHFHLRNLGIAYERAAQYPLAIETFRQLLDIDPKNKPALYHLGLMALTIGQWGKAAKWFKKLSRVCDKGSDLQTAQMAKIANDLTPHRKRWGIFNLGAPLLTA
jgi:tetratricopeptide (TPR) repeat protein